jgi:hypothetical protein
MSKRILVISDTHCGHLTGATPPAFQLNQFKESETKRNKWAVMQKEAWIGFKKLLTKYAPFDLAFHLGDSIDGKGSRCGGVDLITSSMEEQADIATAVCDTVRLHANKGFKWYGVSGTPYHVDSDGDAWDSVVARRAGFERMGAHEWIDVNGCVFDLKHKLGSSSVPHGRQTALSKERLWNQLWAERQPKANVVLRGHVHYHTYCGGADWLAMSCPALQGWTKFGSTQCCGTVDWGIVVFDVDNKGRFQWTSDMVVLESAKAVAVKA